MSYWPSPLFKIPGTWTYNQYIIENEYILMEHFYIDWRNFSSLHGTGLATHTKNPQTCCMCCQLSYFKYLSQTNQCIWTSRETRVSENLHIQNLSEEKRVREEVQRENRDFNREWIFPHAVQNKYVSYVLIL